MDKRRDWSIMTVSKGGTVSVIRDLTEQEAAKIYERLDPFYGQHVTLLVVHDDFKEDEKFLGSFGSSSVSMHRGTIETREVFGPAGWEKFPPGMVSIWPKHTTVWTDAQGNILPDEYQDDVNLARRERFVRQATERANPQASLA